MLTMFRARFGFGGTVKNIVAWLGLSLMVVSFVWWQILSIPRPAASVRHTAAPAPFTLVVLDPGHGGQDSGAMCGAIFEKDLTLDIAQRVDRLLQAQGIATLMTRVGDSYVSLADRAAVTMHSTARQAAQVAADAEVGLLALTHLSSRYTGGEIRDEARAVFARTEVPRDFDTIEVPFPERGEPELIRWNAEAVPATGASPPNVPQ